jgi:hypothetical protein
MRATFDMTIGSETYTVKAVASKVTPYEATNLHVELFDENEEPVDLDFDEDTMTEIEERATEELYMREIEL